MKIAQCKKAYRYTFIFAAPYSAAKILNVLYNQQLCCDFVPFFASRNCFCLQMKIAQGKEVYRYLFNFAAS